MSLNIKEIFRTDLDPFNTSEWWSSKKIEKLNWNFDQVEFAGGGPRGPQGTIGDIGPEGVEGDMGNAGNIGNIGNQGRQGTEGKNDWAANINLDRRNATLKVIQDSLDPTNALIGFNNSTSTYNFAVGASINEAVQEFRSSTSGEISKPANTNDTSFYVGGSFTAIPERAPRIAILDQNGDMDPSFNPNVTFGTGWGYHTGGNVTDSPIRIKQAIRLNDGKILVCGNFVDWINTVPFVKRIAKINVGGSIDQTFSRNASDAVDSIDISYDGIVDCMAVQSDGKILIGGNFTGGLARLNQDGTLDNEFIRTVGSTNTPVLNGRVRTIAVYHDDSFFIGGDFTRYNVSGGSFNRQRIQKLLPNGDLDRNWSATGSGLNGPVNKIIIHNEQVLAVGAFSSTAARITPAIRKIVRYVRASSDSDFPDVMYSTSEGRPTLGGKQISNSFTNTRIFQYDINDTGIWDVAVQGDGKILIGGDFTRYDNRNRFGIARINDDGSIDDTFNSKGDNEYDVLTHGDGFHMKNQSSYIVYSIKVQEDGKILVGGRFERYGRTIAFSPNSNAYNIDILNFTFCNNIIRLNPNGTPDIALESGDNEKYTVFGTGFGGSYISKNTAPTNSLVREIILIPSNKIMVVGEFVHYRGDRRNRIIGIKGDSQVDSTFNTGDGIIDGALLSHDSASIIDMAVRKDGRLLILSNSISNSGISRYSQFNNLNRFNRVFGINQDGTRDTTFNSELISENLSNINTFNGEVSVIELQEDGKILIGGRFTSYKGVTSNRIIRLNEDGSRDSSFNIGSGFSLSQNSIITQVRAIKVLSNGKILVGGEFSDYGGNSVAKLVRLEHDGRLDTTFITDSSISNNGFPYVIQIQNDGNILVGGTFINKLVRLNSNGVIDEEFSQKAPWLTPNVNAIAVQSDGKIIAGGTFSTLTGMSIVRLNTDGSIDINFKVTPGTGSRSSGGFPASIDSVAIQPDGKILLGGDFEFINGKYAPNIARLNTDGSIDTTFNLGFNYKVNVIKINNPIILDEPQSRKSNFMLTSSDVDGNVTDFKIRKSVVGNLYFNSDESSSKFELILNADSSSRSRYRITKNPSSKFIFQNAGGDSHFEFSESLASFNRNTRFIQPTTIVSVNKFTRYEPRPGKIAYSDSTEPAIVKWGNPRDIIGGFPIGSIIAIDSDFNNTLFDLTRSGQLSDNQIDQVIGKPSFNPPVFSFTYGAGLSTNRFSGWYLCNGKNWYKGSLSYQVPNLSSFDLLVNYKFQSSPGGAFTDANLSVVSTRRQILASANLAFVANFNGSSFSLSNSVNSYIDSGEPTQIFAGSNTGNTALELIGGANQGMIFLVYLGEPGFKWDTSNTTPTLNNIELGYSATASILACAASNLPYKVDFSAIWEEENTWETRDYRLFTQDGTELARTGFYKKNGIVRYWNADTGLFSGRTICPSFNSIELVYNTSVISDAINGPFISLTKSPYFIDGNTLSSSTSVYLNQAGSEPAPAGWYRDSNSRRYWNGTSFIGATITLEYVRYLTVLNSAVTQLDVCLSGIPFNGYYQSNSSTISTFDLIRSLLISDDISTANGESFLDFAKINIFYGDQSSGIYRRGINSNTGGLSSTSACSNSDQVAQNNTMKC
jgi:uncharacterized delta-60 repeat protein